MEDKLFFEQVAKSVKSNKELALIYNRIMGTNLSIDTIRKKANALGYHIKDNIGTNDLRSKEHLEWIESNKDKYETTTELHKAYNEHFNSNIKHGSFAYILKNVIKPKNKIEYTEEETQWFKDNVHKYFTRLQVKYAFNKEFNKNLTINEINHKIGYMKLHCSRPPKKEKIKIIKPKKIKEPKPRVIPSQCISMFSEEQQNWLRENVKNYTSHPDVYKNFQKQFNTNFTYTQVRDFCHRKNLLITKSFLYNEEELQWMYDNYNRKLHRKELVKLFEEKFNKKLNPNTFKAKCNANGIFKDKENYIDGSLEYAFPIGTEKIFNGEIHIKINNIKETNRNRKSDRAYHKNWVRKHKYVWEQANGPVPKGYYLCFRDGNKLNCELSNLYLATHSELGLLAKNKVYGYEEYTDAYLDILRLEKELLNGGTKNGRIR